MAGKYRLENKGMRKNGRAIKTGKKDRRRETDGVDNGSDKGAAGSDL